MHIMYTFTTVAQCVARRAPIRMVAGSRPGLVIA